MAPKMRAWYQKDLGRESESCHAIWDRARRPSRVVRLPPAARIRR